MKLIEEKVLHIDWEKESELIEIIPSLEKYIQEGNSLNIQIKHEDKIFSSWLEFLNNVHNENEYNNIAKAYNHFLGTGDIEPPVKKIEGKIVLDPSLLLIMKGNGFNIIPNIIPYLSNVIESIDSTLNNPEKNITENLLILNNIFNELSNAYTIDSAEIIKKINFFNDHIFLAPNYRKALLSGEVLNIFKTKLKVPNLLINSNREDLLCIVSFLDLNLDLNKGKLHAIKPKHVQKFHLLAIVDPELFISKIDELSNYFQKYFIGGADIRNNILESIYKYDLLLEKPNPILRETILRYVKKTHNNMAWSTIKEVQEEGLINKLLTGGLYEKLQSQNKESLLRNILSTKEVNYLIPLISYDKEHGSKIFYNKAVLTSIFNKIVETVYPGDLEKNLPQLLKLGYDFSNNSFRYNPENSILLSVMENKGSFNGLYLNGLDELEKYKKYGLVIENYIHYFSTKRNNYNVKPIYKDVLTNHKDNPDVLFGIFNSIPITGMGVAVEKLFKNLSQDVLTQQTKLGVPVYYALKPKVAMSIFGDNILYHKDKTGMNYAQYKYLTDFFAFTEVVEKQDYMNLLFEKDNNGNNVAHHLFYLQSEVANKRLFLSAVQMLQAGLLENKILYTLFQENNDGITPLHYLLKNPSDNGDCIKELLKDILANEYNILMSLNEKQLGLMEKLVDSYDVKTSYNKEGIKLKEEFLESIQKALTKRILNNAVPNMKETKKNKIKI